MTAVLTSSPSADGQARPRAENKEHPKGCFYFMHNSVFYIGCNKLQYKTA